MSLSDKQREFARERANGCCEYCLLSEGTGTAPFHVDHVRPRKLHGSDEPDNLCFACNQGNHAKGSNVSGYDPSTDALTPLFHPRKHNWSDHFRLEENSTITGLTSEERTTIDVLKFNQDNRTTWRHSLRQLGAYPCQAAE